MSWPGVVGWGRKAALVLGIAGVVDGVVMIANRHVTPCPDGKEFGPNETDFNCYAHPQAVFGVGLVVVTLLLVTLVLLAVLVAEKVEEPHQ